MIVFVERSLDYQLIRYSLDVHEDVFNPSAVFSQDLEANTLALTSPVLDKLAKEAHLRCYWRNAVGAHNKVITVTSHHVADHLVGVAFQGAVWEWSILRNVLKDGKVPWVSGFNVIWLSAIVWPYELVSRGVAVDHKLNFMLVGCDEVSDSSWLWLRECFVTRPVITAQFSAIFRTFFLPVNTIVSVKINSRVLISTGSNVVWIWVLSLVYDLAIIHPVFFHQGSSVTVNNRDKEELGGS